MGDDPIDFNLIKLASNPDAGTLIDYVEGLPVFADMKVVIVNDVKPDVLDTEDYQAYLDIIGNVPDTTVLVFSITGIELNETKKAVKNAINENTKAIIPVDIGGVMCDYEKIFKIVNAKKDVFKATSDLQKAIGRVVVVADSAHGFGAKKKINGLIFITLQVGIFRLY